MRRTDRLFELVLLFRNGRLWRGRDLAEKLEVSLRTVYRDIDTLVASGLPIEGERGVGYILREPIFLPPLTLSHLELEAFHLGIAMVEQSGAEDLALSAKRLKGKIDAVLPPSRLRDDPLQYVAAYPRERIEGLKYLSIVRKAIEAREILSLSYNRLDNETSERTVRPLHLEYWGKVWTCTCWCELRNDFRVFRIDRIGRCDPTGRFFEVEPGKTYEDYLIVFDCTDTARRD